MCQFVLSLRQISEALRLHQKRLQLGDDLPTLTELAERAGVHRDTLYEALNGRRINQVSQVRLSRMLQALEHEQKPVSRIMYVSLPLNTHNAVNDIKLRFGIGPLCPTSAPLRQIWRLEERRISGSS